MNEYKEYTAKTVDDAITEACENLSVTSSRLDYQIVTEGSAGFLGMGVKPAIIRARIKDETTAAAPKAEEVPVQKASVPVKAAVEAPASKEHTKESKPVNTANVDENAMCESARTFLTNVFHAMDMPVSIEVSFDTEELVLNVDISGEDMGVLIGKRGQTLDSLQYLVSLVVNRDQENYIHVKVDTENYRQRRKATLDNLAKNIAFKVRKTHQSVSLEPMNPYERRIIHSALQNDRYVTTHSEGEEPYRRVVVTLKR